MKLTLVLFVFILLLIKTTQVYASPLDKFFNVLEPTFMDNCDSEEIREYRNTSIKNTPKTYSDRNHWFNEIKKADRRKDYCRKAQALFHLYNFLPWKEFHALEIQKQVVESLYQGNYFLELQWQIRNYREMYGTNPEVEIIQVKSYWPFIDKINESQKCISPTGYYTNPKTGEDYNLVTEAFLSANDYLKANPDSPYASEVQSKISELKDARVLKLMCEVKSSLNILNNRRGKKVNAYHYFAVYKRLSEVIVNFKEQDGIDETIYMLIGICNKIHQEVQAGPLTSGGFEDHPDEYIFDENWQEKSSKLLEILKENFPDSPWLAKL